MTSKKEDTINIIGGVYDKKTSDALNEIKTLYKEEGRSFVKDMGDDMMEMAGMPVCKNIKFPSDKDNFALCRGCEYREECEIYIGLIEDEHRLAILRRNSKLYYARVKDTPEFKIKIKESNKRYIESIRGTEKYEIYKVRNKERQQKFRDRMKEKKNAEKMSGVRSGSQ